MRLACANEECPLTDAPDNALSRTIDRRTVLKAGAWSAPVIAVAATAPLAAATGGWDLSLEPPQFGADVPLFTGDLTGTYTVPEPVGYVIGNRGATASPLASIAITLELDRRLWDVTGLQYRPIGSSDLVDAVHGTPTIDGDVARHTWTIVASVPPNTTHVDGILVRPTLRFLGEYPDDHFDDIVPVSWILTPPAGDADATNNIVLWPATGAVTPAAPFGAVTEVDWESVVVGTSHTTYRPAVARLTSVGPHPIPAGDRVLVNIESQATSAVDVDGDALLDGVPTPGLVTLDETGPSGDSDRQYYFRIDQPIPAGSVLSIPFASTDAGGSGGESSASWVTYWPADLNSPDQRAQRLAQAQMDPTPL